MATTQKNVHYLQIVFYESMQRNVYLDKLFFCLFVSSNVSDFQISVQNFNEREKTVLMQS